MNESIYKTVKNSFSRIFKIIYNIQQNGLSDEFGINQHFAFDPLLYTIEIDQLKKENPETHETYLKKIYLDYSSLLIECEALEQPRNISNEFEDPILNHLSSGIKQIVDHLKGLLNPKSAIQEPPKPTPTPKGQTQLNAMQTALLFWCLRNKRLIADPTNVNMSTAIELLSGYSETQMKSILKVSGAGIYELGKDNDKLMSEDFRIVISQLKGLIKYIEDEHETNKKLIGLR